MMNSIEWIIFCSVYTVCLIGKCVCLKPVIVEQPNDAYGLSLQRVELRCVPDPDTANITWYKEGEVVESYRDKPVSSNRLMEKHKLIFLTLDVQDEGVYYCNASTMDGWTRSKNASVRIAYLGKDMSGPEPTQASIGETVVMKCRGPHGVPRPRISWKKDGRELNTATNKRLQVLRTGSLRIDGVSRQDQGKYACVAKNFASVLESDGAYLTVRQKPQFTRVPSNVRVQMNGVAVFPCEAIGDPRPMIMWTRKNGGVMPNHRVDLLQDRALQISRVQPDDAGSYICRAKNSAGVVEAVARLTVVSSPGLLETPESQTVEPGATATFHCRTTGAPQPDVVWSHNGDHFFAASDSNTPQRISVERDGTLVIKSVRMSDSGKYSCEASSYNGRAHSFAYLIVKDARQSIEIPPLILVPPQNQTLRIGLTATFHCRPDKSATLVWFKDDTPLLDVADPRVILLNKGALLKINNLRSTDAAKYTCRLSTQTSRTEWTVIMKILDKNDYGSQIQQTPDELEVLPDPPANFEVVDRGSTWIQLKWHHNQESHILHYLIQYYPYSDKQGWSMSKRVTTSPTKLEHLLPQTGYRILIRSVSEIGTGTPNVLPSVVFTQPQSRATISTVAMDYEALKKHLNKVKVSQLEQKSVGRVQVALKWRISGPISAIRIVAGYEVHYEAVPLTRCVENGQARNLEHCSLRDEYRSRLYENQAPINGANQMKLVSSQIRSGRPLSSEGDIVYTMLTDLHPFQCYEINVKPYVDHTKYGRMSSHHQSNVLAVLTYDAEPGAAPTNLRGIWLSNSSLQISWKHPEKQELNGVLKGYSLYVIGNNTNNTRAIEVSPQSTQTTVRDLNRARSYTIHLAASNCKGEGVRSPGLFIPPNHPLHIPLVLRKINPKRARSFLLRNNQLLENERSGDSSHTAGLDEPITQQPWFISILVVGVLLWLLVCSVVVMVCRGMYIRGILHKSSGYANGTKGGVNSQPTASTVTKDTVILTPLITNNNNNNNNNSSATSPLEYNKYTEASLPTVGSSCLDQTRRFHDSGSNSSSNNNGRNSDPDLEAKQRVAYNNVAPYATASLLQQCVGISTKNASSSASPPHLPPPSSSSSTNNFNQPSPFNSNTVATGNMFPMDLQTNPAIGPLLLGNNQMDWINADISNGMLLPQYAANQMAMYHPTMAHPQQFPNSTAVGGASGGHVLIPPPPQFPPPPAPVSPSNTNIHHSQPHHDDAASYASCPVDDDEDEDDDHVRGVGVPTSASTTSPMFIHHPNQQMFWAQPGSIMLPSNNHTHHTGALIPLPMPGYVDYSCTPFNLINSIPSGSSGAGTLNMNSILGSNNAQHHHNLQQQQLSDAASSSASSFALPPPHDGLTRYSISDDAVPPPQHHSITEEEAPYDLCPPSTVANGDIDDSRGYNPSAMMNGDLKGYHHHGAGGGDDMNCYQGNGGGGKLFPPPPPPSSHPRRNNSVSSSSPASSTSSPPNQFHHQHHPHHNSYLEETPIV